MSNQGSLFSPGFANREEPIQARLLARKTDPATSKRAAKRIVESGRLTKQQEWALAILQRYGPGTCWQLAYRQPIEEPVGVHFLLARRFPELERKGLVRVQMDGGGREQAVQGSRVWEVVPK